MSVEVKKFVVFLAMNISKSKPHYKAKWSLLECKCLENSILNFSAAL